MAYAGKKAAVKVAGTPVAIVGEKTSKRTTDIPDTQYQITFPSRRVLDVSSPISVHTKVTGTSTAGVGTTETNVVMTAHGLAVGDLVYNIFRDASRVVTAVIDANTFTVAAITGQASGNTFEKYKIVPKDQYTLDALDGMVIFNTSASRTVVVTGNYIPTTVAAECYEWSLTANADLIDVTKFGDDWTTKIQGLKSAEGSLSRWFNVDKYFSNALVSGAPVLIELYTQDTLLPERLWAFISSDEMSAAVDGASEEAVSFESTEKLLMQYTT